MTACQSEEVNHLTNRITKQHGRPLLIDKLLEASVANNISALVFGRRFPFEDPVRAFFDSRNDKLARVFATGAHYVFFPRWIFYIRNLLPSSGARIVKEVYEEIARFISGEVESHESSLDDTDNRDFIDGYMKKIKEDRDSQVSNFKIRYRDKKQQRRSPLSREGAFRARATIARAWKVPKPYRERVPSSVSRVGEDGFALPCDSAGGTPVPAVGPGSSAPKNVEPRRGGSRKRKLSKQKQRVYFRGTQWCLRRSIPRGGSSCHEKRALSASCSSASPSNLEVFFVFVHAPDDNGDDIFDKVHP
ncbi:hypothetical protein HPB48_017344 [Haemaphysalis longicornis]|uniref:Cytochrome P450 n=1 Tax=Haemaphysalis longicornis TaxID=44386 RepID=A0A9J6GY73_HAELO|nr:hypothetical protein HPB48_017344 [Haemaphysalis longicornis]